VYKPCAHETVTHMARIKGTSRFFAADIIVNSLTRNKDKISTLFCGTQHVASKIRTSTRPRHKRQSWSRWSSARLC